jgi:dTDP-4-dehydrorhamnose reductase
MRILVTGATGLLGTDLCRALAKRHQVIGWARRLRPAVDPSVTWESVDITDAQATRGGIHRWQPHLVIHSAALSDVDACERDPAAAYAVNAEGTEKVARATAEVGAFLIAVSTDYVFDGSADRPYREEDKTAPVNVYGQAKRKGEEAALACCRRCLVVRVSGLFGAGRPNFVSQAVQRLRTGQEVPAVSDQVNSPSYTVDLAGAFSRLIEMSLPGGPLPGILHLANSGSATRLDLAQQIARFLDLPASLIQQTTWASLNRPAKRPGNSRLDCGRFAQISGADLRPWPEALASFLQAQALDSRLIS